MTMTDMGETEREAYAVKGVAEEIAARYAGKEAKPTSYAYDEALKIIEFNRAKNPETADLIIDSLNLWAEIKTTVGSGFDFGAVLTEAMAHSRSEVLRHIKSNEGSLENSLTGIVSLTLEAMRQNPHVNMILNDNQMLLDTIGKYIELVFRIGDLAAN